MIPMVLLDVDGVLNHFPRWIKPIEDVWDAGDCISFEAANGFEINARKRVLEFFRELHQSGKAEIHWLTTWGHDANEMLSKHFEFPEFSVAGSPPGMWMGHGWWKLDIVKRIVELNPDRKIVWVDDEINSTPAATIFVDEIHQKRIDTLLAVSPHPEKALSDADLEQIRRFLA